MEKYTHPIISFVLALVMSLTAIFAGVSLASPKVSTAQPGQPKKNLRYRRLPTYIRKRGIWIMWEETRNSNITARLTLSSVFTYQLQARPLPDLKSQTRAAKHPIGIHCPPGQDGSWVLRKKEKILNWKNGEIQITLNSK